MALITIHPGLENRPKPRGKLLSGREPHPFFFLRKGNTFSGQPLTTDECGTDTRGFGIEPDMGV